MASLGTYDVSAAVQAKLAEFFARVSHASPRALLLDYDGTLAPFTADRNLALPFPEVPALLDRIRSATDTRLALISGRNPYEVASLLGMKNLDIWGCHGLSRLHPDGHFDPPEVDAKVLARISAVRARLEGEGLARRLELKPGSVAVHWRGHEAQASQIARQVEKAWSVLPERKALELAKFDGGIEIRVVGRHKGDAVRTVLSETGPGTVAAYLGDDLTDEDAFAALQGRGLSVLVRPQYRPTRAEVWIRPPQGPITFLNDWLTACGGAS